MRKKLRVRLDSCLTVPLTPAIQVTLVHQESPAIPRCLMVLLDPVGPVGLVGPVRPLVQVVRPHRDHPWGRYGPSDHDGRVALWGPVDPLDLNEVSFYVKQKTAKFAPILSQGTDIEQSRHWCGLSPMILGTGNEPSRPWYRLSPVMIRNRQ